MKTAIIDVGGGMRGIYACGVFDHLLDEGINFDTAYGISAGSANVTSYLAKQRGRNHTFYTEYSFRPEYMCFENLVRNHSYIDLDYVYSTLSNADGENPLDWETLRDNPSELVIIAANAESGKTAYFTKRAMGQDNYNVLKASSAIPVFSHPYEVAGVEYFDGALGDTIPLERAFIDGAERVVLVLTKPVDHERSATKDIAMAKLLKWRYPLAAERLCTRAQRYNEGVALAKVLQEDGLVLIVAPDDTCGVDTLKKTPESLEVLYQKGLADARAIDKFLA